MDIEFLRKNSLLQPPEGGGGSDCIKVRSDILIQTASEEDLKYIESYYKWLYNLTLTDVINTVYKDWIVINDDLELGWKFDFYRIKQ